MTTSKKTKKRFTGKVMVNLDRETVGALALASRRDFRTIEQEAAWILREYLLSGGVKRAVEYAENIPMSTGGTEPVAPPIKLSAYPTLDKAPEGAIADIKRYGDPQGGATAWGTVGSGNIYRVDANFYRDMERDLFNQGLYMPMGEYGGYVYYILAK